LGKNYYEPQITTEYFEQLVDWLDPYPFTHFITLTFKDKVNDWYAPNKKDMAQYKFWKDPKYNFELDSGRVEPRNTVGLKWVRECMEIFEEVNKEFNLSYFAVLEKGAKGTKRYHVHSLLGDLEDKHESEKQSRNMLKLWAENYGMVHCYTNVQRSYKAYLLKYTLKNPELDLWGSLKAKSHTIEGSRSFYDMCGALGKVKEKQSKRKLTFYHEPLKQVNDYTHWGWT